MFLPIALSLCAAGCAEKAVEPPNVVFIFSDQKHYQAMSSVDEFFDTPNLDALAASSVVFENSFVTSPQCSPSCASMMTGLYPHKTGMLNNVGSAGGTELALPTIASHMQEGGYVTGFMGKWHLGGDEAGNSGWDVQAANDGNEECVDADTTNQALSFLEQHSGGDKPLFMFLMYNDPHDIYYFQHLPDRDPERHKEVVLGESWYKENLAVKPEPQLAYMQDNQGLIIHGREKEEWQYYRDYYRQK